MDEADFDELIEAMVETLRSIRDARPEEPPVWLERFLVRNEDGEVSPLTLSFQLPVRPGESDGEIVELPLFDVVPPVQLGLASLSVELDCVLEEVPAPDATGETRMMMSLRPSGRERREGVDKVRITVRAGDPIEATAYVNGRPFKTVP